MRDMVLNILKDLVEVQSAICVAYEKIHVEAYDFDLRQYFETKPIFNEVNHPIILRMGALQDYTMIYEALEEMGLNLVHTPKQHEMASLLPHWYPEISDLTIKSKWYEEIPSVDEVLCDFDFPIFLKGERQTNRHKFSTSVAKNKSDLQNILNYWKTDNILHWQRLICRAFVKFEKIADHDRDQVQYSKEIRVFVWKGTVVGMGQYWTEVSNFALSLLEKEQIIRLAEEASFRVQVPFLVVDVAKMESGGWMVIELNDGQESGYAGVYRWKLWTQIIELEKKKLP